jgi:Matrixin
MIRRWAWLVAGGLGVTAAPAHAEGPRRTTVFLDFGGGPISPGDDSSLGQATCVPVEFRYPIFLGSHRAAQIAVAEAQRLVAPFGVRVVAERPPAHLPYTHVRVGGDPATLGLDPKLNGLACDVDCGDASHRDTVFMFAEKWVTTAALEELSEDERARQVGRIAMHEVGHAWGLEHAGSSGSVMARFPGAVAPEFAPGCLALDIDHDASECRAARERYCAEGQQDAHAELLALFGDGEADGLAPHAEILWPPDGHEMQPGETLAVEVEVGDDHEGFGWMLEVPELGWEHVGRPNETALALVVPEGRFTLRLEVLDHDRNVGEAEVVIEARWPEEGVEPEPPAPRAACACTEAGPRGAGAWWAVLVLVLASCRRPRVASRRR